jgi:hypothetical protein
VECAIINADGTLGAFYNRATLQTARSGHRSVIIGNYLYVLGGRGSNYAYLNSVERALINADGTLGAFTDAGVTLQTGRDGHSSVVIGDYLYVLGGYGNFSYQASVERAPINPDGTLGAFTTTAVTLQTARALHGSVIIGDKLYLLGGSGSAGALSSIERATIHADGTLGAFTDAGFALAGSRSVNHAILLGNHLYVMGGLLDSSKKSIARALLR